MAKKHPTFSDELRQAIIASGVSRYRISKELGFPQSQLSRFMNAKGGLSVGRLDAIAAMLDIHVAAGQRHKPKG